LLAQRITQWRLLNRNRITISNHSAKNIDWENSVRYIQPTPITNFSTNSEDHNNRKFRNKLWNLELPTKTKLHQRNPKTYTNDRCIQCKTEAETTTHPFTCSTNQTSIRQQFKQIYNEEISARADQPCKKQLNTQLSQQFDYMDTEMLDLTIRGCINNQTHSTVKKFVKTDQVKECLHSCAQRISKTLFQIWKKRCDRFCEWESKEKILRKHKKTWYNSNNRPHNSTNNNIKTLYTEIVNKYMEEYCNSLAGVNRIFIISLNIGIGSALVC